MAKAAAYWQVTNYREAYRIHACTGILFNHESPLRPERYVTRKIVAAACRISAGSGEKLVLGNMEIERDWGWAPEYVQAMWLMLQRDVAEDYVIATGTTRSLKDFVAAVFSKVHLDWMEHVRSDSALFRPTDIRRGTANPRKATEELGWKATSRFDEVVNLMVDAELETTPKP